MAPVDRSNLSRSGAAAAYSTADNATSADGIVVFIPAALKRPSHTLYCICVKVDETPHGGGCAEWSVNRRYSQFLELRKQILLFLQRSPTCPGCQSMTRAVGSFPFPPKAFFRTNKLVRQRTKDLQTFVEIVIARTFSTAPKCVTCGIGTMNLVWPFFNRGAQYISRQSILHRPVLHTSVARDDRISPSSKSHAKKKREATSDCSTTDSVHDMNDYEVHRRTTHRLNGPSASMDDISTSGDPAFLTCRSDQSSSSTANDSSLIQLQYRSLKQEKAAFLLRTTSTPEPTTATAAAPFELSYLDGAMKCTDPRTSVANIQEALDEVIIADGHTNTKEEKMYRLSTMWEAFELEDIQREIASNRGTKHGILV